MTTSVRAMLLGAVGGWAALAAAAAAQTVPGSPQATGAQAAAPTTVQDVVVTAQRLNAARASIQPSLGATTYAVTNATIQALPAGDNQELSQVVLQLPGVVQDGGGQLHVRDDHNNLEYRLNGVILPEGISVFGQTLSPRLVDKLDLITGALPAQYGLRTAGIIDITTKSGAFHNGGQVSIYGGSHGTYEPSFEYEGSALDTNFFVSGDFRRTQLGIDSVDGRSTPDHDRADNANVFTYIDKTLNENNRIAFVGGYSNERFQIPNPVGLQPDGAYALNGQTAFPSQDLNETQRETTGLAQLSLLHDQGKLTLQSSVFARYSTLTYYPDTTGELLFNGQTQYAHKTNTAFGLQNEAVYRLTDAHTLRGGVIIQGERSTSFTQSQVFPGDPGAPTSDMPIVIPDSGAKTQFTYSVYLQDEWKILHNLTLNYGLRGDDVNGYRNEKQLSPRINVVYQPFDGTTLHAGYARYFTPPPFELVANTTVSLFNGTTGAAANPQDTTPYAERQNYYDIGAEQKIRQVPGLTVSVDGYYRNSHNLIDEGQFGAPIILTPFNYRYGYIEGLEFNANYSHGPWLAYLNFAVAKAQGKDIVSSQFSFDPGDLAYIANHYIYLDHDQTYTGSAGVSYAFRNGVLDGTTLGADLLYGSGLRADGDVPNGNSLNDYTQVNLTAGHSFDLPYAGKIAVKFDVINVADAKYFIRDGSGIGVGAPEYGPRRGYFVGLTKSF